MRPVVKILIALILVIFFFIGSLSGIGVWYYHHPSNIKSLVEKSISRYTGTSCTIKTLSYSLDPPMVEARGIIIDQGEIQEGFHLEIQGLRADIGLEGAFSRKSLIFKKLKVDGFSLRLSKDMNLTVPGKG